MTVDIVHCDCSLALDPGSRQTGWSVMGRDECLLQAGLLLPERLTDASEIRIGAMCDNLRELLGQWRPTAVILEWTSGKVNIRRHGGGGAGLAVHGAATGALWREAEAWWRSLADEHQAQVQIIVVRENEWTHGTHKRDRIAAVQANYPAYNCNDDPGGDIADAISLNQWHRRQCRAMASAGSFR